MKKALAPLHFNQKVVTEAPVLLTFCADFNRFNKWCLLGNAEPGYDNFLSFVTASIDALLVAQTVCVAAESKGLGICYLGTTTYMAHKIIEVLKLPKGVVPITTVTMGWPAEIPEQDYSCVARAGVPPARWRCCRRWSRTTSNRPCSTPGPCSRCHKGTWDQAAPGWFLSPPASLC